MVKAIAYSVCAVLLITSGVHASVGPQSQVWNISLASDATLFGGQGNANTTQSLGTLNLQGDTNGEGAQAWQGMGALVGQTAVVTTVGAPIGVTQTVNIAGDVLGTGLQGIALGQAQNIGDYADPSLQYEGVSLGATQALVKDAGGLGTAAGGNQIAFGMAQVGGDVVGTGLGQGSVVLGEQQAQLNGTSPASAGSVVNGVTFIVIQDQAVNMLQQ